MSVLYLVRHADAGPNVADPLADSERALTPRGLTQADQLALLLRPFAVDRILTSPALRCRQTINPLATSLGVEPATTEHLGERADPAGALALADAVVTEHPTVPVAMCSHGTIIPEVIRLLGLRGMQVTGPRGCAKGSVWELHHDGERWLSGSYLPPQAG